MLLSEVVCDLSKNYYQSIEWQCFVLNSFSIGSCLTAFGSEWNIAVCAVCFNQNLGWFALCAQVACLWRKGWCCFEVT